MTNGLVLLPWQARALTTPLDCDVILAGGRGSGKTSACAALILQLVALQPGARVLVVRRSFPGLQDFLSLTMSLFPQADSGARYSGATHVWTFSNKATCELGVLDCEADLQRVQGRNFHAIIVDEAGQYHDPRWIDLLRSCLRAPKGEPVRMILSANPGGPGHGWLFRRYVSRGTPWLPFVDSATGRQSVVISSTFKDNSFLDGAAYERQLRAACAGDPELLKAWAGGNWAIARGAALSDVLEASRVMVEPWDHVPTFTAEVAAMKEHERRQLRNTRRGFGHGASLPKWRPFLSYDHGCAAPSATYLMLESPGGRGPDGRYYPKGSLVAHDELVTLADPDNLNRGNNWTVPRLAEEIKGFCSRWGVEPSGYADDAIFSRTGSELYSIAAEFEKHGVSFEPAGKGNRVAGWSIMRQMLEAAGSTDRAGLHITRRCWYAWQTLPSLPRDPRQPDDVDSRGADHGADALRYACTATGAYISTGGVIPYRRVY